MTLYEPTPDGEIADGYHRDAAEQIRAPATPAHEKAKVLALLALDARLRQLVDLGLRIEP